MGESRQELLTWVNDLLQLNYTKIEQMGTGRKVDFTVRCSLRLFEDSSLCENIPHPCRNRCGSMPDFRFHLQ